MKFTWGSDEEKNTITLTDISSLEKTTIDASSLMTSFMETNSNHNHKKDAIYSSQKTQDRHIFTICELRVNFVRFLSFLLANLTEVWYNTIRGKFGFSHESS